MSMYPNPYGSVRPGPLDYESSANSVTLARFFNAVYGWMAAGLALTGTLPGGCRRRNFGRRPVGWWERSPALRALAAPE